MHFASFPANFAVWTTFLRTGTHPISFESFTLRATGDESDNLRHKVTGGEMAGQDLYQVVSTGRTLHAKGSDQVVRDAAKLFAIPEPQARRLLLKGWVIKDQLASSQALELRAGLQKIGLRVEVCPAGKFDNQQLIARIKVAQRHKARAAKGAPPSDSNSAGRSHENQPKRAPGKRSAATKVEATVTAKASTGGQQFIGDSKPPITSFWGRALVGLLPALVLPVIFMGVAALCLYGAGYALWQIPMAAWQGELSGGVVAFSLLMAACFIFLLSLFVFPYLWFPRNVGPKPSEIPLNRSEGRELFRLFEQLSEKTGLPRVQEVTLSPDAQVFTAPTFAQVMRQELPLNVGLASVASLRGGEGMALVARGLGLYQGKLHGLLAWLVLDGVYRLERMQWALENERSALCTSGEPNRLQKPLHQLLVACGYFLLPLVERLEGLHRTLTKGSAKYLESRADLWAADLIGSEAFAAFAERWHRLIHADLIVAETGREAAALGQCFENIPAAVAWILDNLDEETCKAIELAMGQTSDPWDACEAADLKRVDAVQQRGLDARIRRAFSLQDLFTDFARQAASVSTAGAGPDCQVVENRRLLCASREVAEAVQVLDTYFNRLPPHSFLPLRRSTSEDMQGMDLQTSIDWLRGKLVELREMRGRSEALRQHMAAMQLGVALIRNKVRINPQDYSLKSASLASAQEAVAVKRSELEETEKQLQQIYAVFYQRLCLALVAMPTKERQEARNLLRHLAAYEALATHLERLAGYGRSLALIAQYLSPGLGERELVQKYLALAARELDATFATVESSDLLKAQGLDSALCIKAKREPLQLLPQRHKEALALVQALEARCKYASSVILEHYQVKLATLLNSCLEREQQMQLNPLRLLRTV
ncbi:hypothetical protein [Microbulbifer epialgicus]|uniref:Uncharacterized protein n=1 Tax=Microbulbifer epialgicus TaxID=393907 RepID=A0ABV4P3A4_9GAMM